jgi:hypothetical protein
MNAFNPCARIIQLINRVKYNTPFFLRKQSHWKINDLLYKKQTKVSSPYHRVNHLACDRERIQTKVLSKEITPKAAIKSDDTE